MAPGVPSLMAAVLVIELLPRLTTVRFPPKSAFPCTSCGD